MGGSATTPTAWATPELHPVGLPMALHEGRRPPPAPRLLECHVPSASTMNAAASPRAASPRRMIRDSVSTPVLASVEAKCSMALFVHHSEMLTGTSPGVVHHPHPRSRRWHVPTVPGPADRSRLEQESSHCHDICPKHRQGQAPQG
jgi:hypothetical protein